MTAPYPARRSGFIAGTVLLIASIALSRVPLFNYLGYEFSAAVALLLPLVLWYPLSRIFRKWETAGEFSHKSIVRLNREVQLRALVLLLIPFLVATCTMFFFRNCAYGEGILYFMLLPGVTSVWCTGLILFCCAVFNRPFRAYLFIIFLVMLYPLILGYAAPEIFSYNFIYGYFPGFSYDEVIRISPTLILFRGITLAMALLFIILAYVISGEPRSRKGIVSSLKTLFAVRGAIPPRMIALVLLLGLMGVWSFRVPLGLETSDDSIRKTLSSSVRTEHFMICYAPESFSSSEIQWVAALHEFRYSQIASALRINTPVMITSFLYPSAEAKRIAIGTATTNIAKPWRKEIHLDAGSWEESLEHELVHVLAGEFGMPLIRAHYHIGLVEGLAVAVTGQFGNRTLHEYAAALKKFQVIRDPGNLLSPIGFATHYSSVSYVLMGSFCRYLLDRYGISRFKELYGGRAAEHVYGRSSEQLVNEWQSFLDRIDVPDSWRSHIDYFFKRPSIFAAECVRTVALLNDDGERKLESRDFERANGYFKKALATSWNASSYGGLIRSAYMSHHFDEVASLGDAVFQDSSRRQSFLGYLLLYGDALWETGDPSRARGVYDQAREFDLSRPFNEALAVRLACLDDSVLRGAFPHFLTAAENDSTGWRFIDSLSRVHHSELVKLLEARLDVRRGKYAEVVDLLQEGRVHFSSPDLNSAVDMVVGKADFRLHRYQNARASFWKSLNFVGTGAALEEVNDWIDRCSWFERFGDRYFSHSQ
ncbi:MAG TPA: hypothetical protein VLY03_04605 [Bacteroidota bacterium]|nr:hypothetical protein [Bacteroidota bacterium]